MAKCIYCGKKIKIRIEGEKETRIVTGRIIRREQATFKIAFADELQEV